MTLLGLAFAGVIGLALGLLGGGGSILTVPVLVYVLGVAAKPAIAMSLPVVGLTSLVGAAAHWRLGNVRLATAALFGVLAMGGAFAGAKLSVFLSGAAQLVLLAVVMLAAAVAMLRTRRGDGRERSKETSPAQWSLLAPVAVAVGVLTGLVGVGGGFLIVPALVLLARVPMRQAVGTSLLVIALNSAAGFGGYIGTIDIDWAFLRALHRRDHRGRARRQCDGEPRASHRPPARVRGLPADRRRCRAVQESRRVRQPDTRSCTK